MLCGRFSPTHEHDRVVAKRRGSLSSISRATSLRCSAPVRPWLETRSRLFALLGFMVVAIQFGMIMPCAGQAVSELPKPQYYVAKELYGAGRIADAAEGFRVSLQRARKIGDQRWIDSIPPMVMLGECLYQQGNLAAALEQYDASLMLLLNHQNWVNQIEYGAEQLPFLEGAAKGIDWFARSQPSNSVAIPEALQVAIDPTQAQAGPNGTIIAPVNLVTRLDATEVLRTLGIAMLRRWQIFGPLAKHSPLAEPMAQYFAQAPNIPVPWLQSSWSVLAGISRLSSSANADASLHLRQGVLIRNQFDYFMSPLALLALAELQEEQGNLQDAMVALQDASLFAAFFEQHAELATSLDKLSSLACATRRTNVLPALQRATVWCNKRSLMAYVAGSVGAAELATYAKNPSLSDRLHSQANAALRPRDVQLPRLQARLAYSQALSAFLQDRGAVGLSSLENALNLMRGNAQTGAVVHSVFQIQMTLNLLAENKLSTQETEILLDDLLAEPGEPAWLLRPLETLAALTTASMPAFERHLELAKLHGNEQQLFQRMDRLQRQRFYESLPLGGRLLAWRHGLLAEPGGLPVEVGQAVQRAMQQTPSLLSNRDRVHDLVKTLRAGDLPMDEKLLSADSRKQFAELEDLASSLENLIYAQALYRQPIPRFVPGGISLTELRGRLAENDLFLAFATTSQAIFAVALRKNEEAFWQITDFNSIEKLILALQQQIGLNGQPRVLPSDVLRQDASWRKSVQELSEALQLDQISPMLGEAKRIIVVPDGSLWYVPFELIPNQFPPTRNALPLIADKSITYLPTIGSYHYAYSNFKAPKNTVGVIGKAFSPNTEVNKETAQAVLDAIPNSEGVFLTEKVSVPSAAWLRLCADQLWLAAKPIPAASAWDQVMLPFPKAKQSALGSWLKTPPSSPRSLVALGMSSSTNAGGLGNGNELFLPACGMLVSGTKSAILTRWPVGGKSSAMLLQRYLDERLVSDSSKAWRRAVIGLWPEDFLIADEPALLPAGKESSALINGMHPMLWSGYLHVGDEQHAPQAVPK